VWACGECVIVRERRQRGFPPFATPLPLFLLTPKKRELERGSPPIFIQNPPKNVTLFHPLFFFPPSPRRRAGPDAPSALVNSPPFRESTRVNQNTGGRVTGSEPATVCWLCVIKAPPTPREKMIGEGSGLSTFSLFLPPTNNHGQSTKKIQVMRNKNHFSLSLSTPRPRRLRQPQAPTHRQTAQTCARAARPARARRPAGQSRPARRPGRREWR
jgi:hypothetical protein